MSPFQVLGLPDGTRDMVAIRRAYAAKVREFRPETDPAGFRAVRDAYETLRAWAAAEGAAPGFPDPTEAPAASEASPGSAAVPGTGGPPGADAAAPPPPVGARTPVGIRSEPLVSEADGGPADVHADGDGARAAVVEPAAPLRTPDDALAAVRDGRLADAAETLREWHRDRRIEEISLVGLGLLDEARVNRSARVPSFVLWVATLVGIERPRLAQALSDAAWQGASAEERTSLDLEDLDRLIRVGRELADAPKAARRAFERLHREGDRGVPSAADTLAREEDAHAQRFLACASNEGTLRHWVRGVAPEFLETADRTFADARRAAIRARHGARPAPAPRKGRSWSWIWILLGASAFVRFAQSGCSSGVPPRVLRTPPVSAEGEERRRRMDALLEEIRRMTARPATAEEEDGAWRKELERRSRERAPPPSPPPAGSEPGKTPPSGP